MMTYTRWCQTTNPAVLAGRWLTEVSVSEAERSRVAKLLSCCWLRHKSELLNLVGLDFLDGVEKAAFEDRECDLSVPNIVNEWYDRNLCASCIYGTRFTAERPPAGSNYYSAGSYICDFNVDSGDVDRRLKELADLMREFMPFQRIEDPPGFIRTADVVDLAKSAFAEKGRSIQEVVSLQNGPIGCCDRHADQQACECLLTATYAPLDNNRLSVLADALEESGLPTMEIVSYPESIMVYGRHRVWSVAVNDNYPFGKLLFECKRREQALEWASKNCGVKKWRDYNQHRYYTGEGEVKGAVLGRVLQHLRSPGPHFRGCWALEFVLRGNTVKE